MPRILVAYASKHGATAEIAERIGVHLADTGLEVDVRRVGRGLAADGYTAFVIGAATYYGRWLGPARRFVRRHQAQLKSSPTWLFASGPLQEAVATDDPWAQVSLPADLRRLADTVAPHGVAAFGGKLDATRLTMWERLLRLPAAGRTLLVEGDFRDWPAVDRWAANIAHELHSADRSTSLG